jgi:hypothetical protein
MLLITSFYAAHTPPLSYAAILSTLMPCRNAEHNLLPSNAHLSSTAMQNPPLLPHHAPFSNLPTPLPSTMLFTPFLKQASHTPSSSRPPKTIKNFV